MNDEFYYVFSLKPLSFLLHLRMLEEVYFAKFFSGIQELGFTQIIIQFGFNFDLVKNLFCRFRFCWMYASTAGAFARSCHACRDCSSSTCPSGWFSRQTKR